MLEKEISRRELLKRTGVIGASALFAGTLTGKAGASLSRAALRSVTPIRGGHLTWALEQDPGHIAPFGNIPTMGRTANELMYESLLEWDKALNVHAALASTYVVKDPKTIDFDIRPGVKFSNGQEVTAADVKYSFDLQMNPPLPGSVSVLQNLPSIASIEVLSKNKVRMHLKTPDGRVFGYLAWQRYSSIVPQGMYSTLNPAVTGIGTGPFMLDGPYVPNDHINYVRNPYYWKKGQPYLDGITYKIITDEQARIAALRAGAIDGALVSVDSAKALTDVNGLKVLHGLTAAFREILFTIKAGETKPWHDQRVRQAMNFAINRQDLINKVYDGKGEYTGHVATGYGPWVIPQSELKSKWEKYDLPMAKKLMADAGLTKGFDIEMKTFSTPLEYLAMAALVQSYLKAININVNIVAQDPATFASTFASGSFEMLLTARGMRGDVDGFVSEFNPSGPFGQTQYDTWFTGYRNVPMWRLVGNGRITLDTKKRMPIYQKLDRLLMTVLLEIPLISINKYQAMNSKLQDMYVAFTDFNTGLRSAWLS